MEDGSTGLGKHQLQIENCRLKIGNWPYQVTARLRISAPVMALCLGLLTVAVYWPATRCDFVIYDDNTYVTSNPHVQHGLTLESLKWAFATPVVGNWHPLTMFSHILDCQLFGLRPWGHHLTSVLLHAVNTVLVFLWLQGLTGARWRSALVAALFGWHPLHVESVAWVAERKDVLSGCFGLLTLIFYSRYGQKRLRSEAGGPNAASIDLPLTPPGCGLDYGLALLCFALGLMSKPMLVTWPFVLLLLDYWPLRRFEFPAGRLSLSTVWRLVREKIPFFALAAVFSVLTFVLHQRGGILTWGESLPLGARVGNALISYGRYLAKLFWPTNLAVFYPHPGYWPLEDVLVAGGLGLGISVVLLRQRRRYPFMLMGWLWFVGTLVPAIQLVPTFEQAMADRYSYLPSIGVFILAVWGISELTLHWRYQGVAAAVAGSAALAACVALTRQQLGFWTDSATLFRHTLAVTENNYFANNALGMALARKGQLSEAITCFEEAIHLQPNFIQAHYNLGLALNLEGRSDEAIRQFQEAIRLKPDYADAYRDLGNTLSAKGRFEEAIENLRLASRLSPQKPETFFDLGMAFSQAGRTREAIDQYWQTLRLNPDLVGALNNLAWVLATSREDALRNGPDAVRLAEHACELTHYAEPLCVGTLAAAYAEAGRFDDAVATARKAGALAEKSGQPAVFQRNQELLRLYRAQKPYHEIRKELGR